MQAEKLERMANQIAANLGYGSDKKNAVASVADHLQRFWAPSMRKKLSEFLEAGGDGLKPDVIAAVKRLQVG